ncbi:unnamed protein product [Schistosoma curassoni]|uniref:Vacuolar fusion protein MON1 homolog n=1 Tax=Schistosoma curassoni TaxID=6186 RepID=A0A183KP87_9TREM|nr:unnamed protein product [Schistosoma curassoni]
MDEDVCSSKREVDMTCSAESDAEPFIDNDALMTTGAVDRILKESESLKSTQLKVVENVAQSSESLLSEDSSSTKSSTKQATCSTPEDPCWTNDLLHVFVLSEAGKPIYSRYGNESDLSSVMSVMQALVSFVANSGDELQLINTTDKKFLFVSRSHLILVAFSPVSEPTPHLLTCLEYVYNQVCYVVFYFALIFHFIKVSLVKNVVIIG